MGTRLVLRMFALLLALSAGAAAAAPPCLDLILAEDGCVGGEDEHGCDDGCCDEKGCGADCDDCACCPVRVLATVSSLSVKLPALRVSARVQHPAPVPRASETEGVFRPPRRSA